MKTEPRMHAGGAFRRRVELDRIIAHRFRSMYAVS
jgi:hypothetical protein